MTLLFVLGGLAAVLIAALRIWAALRHVLARNLVHEIAELLETIDGEESAVATAGSLARPASGYARPAIRSALLGARLAGAVEAFLGLAAELARAKRPSSAKSDETVAFAAQRRRVEDLGEITLRALRDILSGRGHNVVTRA